MKWAGDKIEIKNTLLRQPRLNSLTVTGKTLEIGTGDKSPDNPYVLLGAQKVKLCQKNLCPNSDFAENTDGWQLLGPNVIRDPSVTLDGSVSIKSEQSGLSKDSWRGAQLSLSNRPFAKPGDRFTASVYIMTDDVSTLDRGVEVEFWQSDTNGVRYYLNSHTINASDMQNNQWKKIALPMNAAIRPNCVSVYIYFFVLRNGRCWFAKPQIEYGDTATSYEPYQGQTVALPQPLYSLPDGTIDSYDVVSGNGTKNIALSLEDGSKSWTFYNTGDSGHSTAYFSSGARISSPKYNNAICSHFVMGDGANLWITGFDKEAAGIDVTKDGLRLRILKSRLPGWSDSWTDAQKVTAFKAWLADNPITVLYELASPQAITGTPQTIPTYYPYTQIVNDAGGGMTVTAKPIGEIKLLQMLPTDYHHSTEIIDIQNALDVQSEKLRGDLNDLLQQLNIETATWGLNLWEDAYGIPHEVTKPFEYRRTRIESKMRSQGITTVAMIKNVAESFSNGEVDIIEHPAEYRFEIKFIGTLGIPPNINDLSAAIEEIKPAHLAYAYIYTYITWNDVENYNHTWDEWDAKNLTWDEFETYKE